MPKVTLLWMAGPEKPFRSYSFRKSTVYVVVGGFFVFLGLSVILGLSTLGLWASSSHYGSANSELQKLLTERDAENRTLKQELNDIQAKENRIRRFLGMNDKIPAEDERANQGGSGGTAPLDYTLDGILCHEEELLGNQRGASRERSHLAESLQEVVDFLSEREVEVRQTPMILPADGEDLWIPSRFGWRVNPITGTGKEFHNGLDIAGHWKTSIIAPADGRVISTGTDRYLGKFVRIAHGSEYTTVYGHLAVIQVKSGSAVKRGDEIGLMGNSGRSTGTHLHYAIVKNNRYVNPVDYIWDRIDNTLALRSPPSDENDDT